MAADVMLLGVAKLALEESVKYLHAQADEILTAKGAVRRRVPMSCNCSTHCDPLHTGHGWPCICIYIHDEHRCICQCNNNPPFEPHAVVLKTIRADETDYGVDPESHVYVHAEPTEAASRRRLAIDAKVDLCVKNATVGNVGALLGSLCLADIAIPAARVNANVSMSLEEVPLGTALQQVGLVVLEERSAEAAPAKPTYRSNRPERG